MDTDERVAPPTYQLCWVAKLETSHALQSNKSRITGVAVIANQSQL